MTIGFGKGVRAGTLLAASLLTLGSLFCVVADAEAAITFVGSTSASATQGTFSFVGTGVLEADDDNTGDNAQVFPDLPAGVAENDLLLMLVTLQSGVTVTGISTAGWNVLASDVATSTTHRSYIYWKYAAAGEANPTVTQGALGGAATANLIFAQIYAFRGVERHLPVSGAVPPTPPFDGAHSFQYSAADLTTEAPAINTVTADTLLIYAALMADDHTYHGPPVPGTWTNAIFPCDTIPPGLSGCRSATTAGNDAALSLWYGTRAATGAQAAVVGTRAGAANAQSHGAQISIRPPLTIDVPAGTTEDDVMIAVIAVRPSTIVITPPTGWTSLIRTEQAAGTPNAQEIFYHVADNAEPASYTWTFSAAGTGMVGGIVSYRGVDTGDPVDVFSGNVTPVGADPNTSHRANGVVTGEADTMIVSTHSFPSVMDWTSPGGMTERVDMGTLAAPNGGGIALEINEVFQAAAGATGDKLATVAANGDTGVAHILALRPPMAYSIWNMDQASWNGTAGEVLDTGTGANHGTAAAGDAGTPPTTAEASPAIPGSPGTCQYGNFTRNPADYDFIALPGGYPNLSAAYGGFTITAWVRTTDNTLAGQRILIDDETNANGNWGFSLGDGGTGRLRFFYRQAAAFILDTPGGSPLANGTWYFVAASVRLKSAAATSRADLYVYDTSGTLVTSASGSFTVTSLGADATPPSIGGETNASAEGSPTSSFSGNLDEVRAYRSALTQTLIDEVRQVTRPCTFTGVDHYAIDFPNGVVSAACEPATVRVTGHDSSDNPVDPSNGTTVTISMSPATGIWDALLSGSGSWSNGGTGVETYTWPGTESSFDVELSHPAAVTGLNVNLLDNFGSTESSVIPSEDPDIDFSALAIRVTADGSSSASVGTHIAAKDTDEAPGQTLYVQLISTLGNACTSPASFAGTHTVQVASECNEPTTCVPTPGSQVSIQNNLGAMVPVNNHNNGAALVYTNVPMEFDVPGVKAPLVVNYPDAGRLTLYFSTTIDPLGPRGPFTFPGASNAFVVRPFALSVESADPNFIAAPADATGTKFKKAGESFDVDVRAVLWQAGDDANDDGNPDSGAVLTDNAVTPNYGQETMAAAVDITHALVLPSAPGDGGTLTGGAGVGGFGSINPGETTVSLSFDEVGIIDLSAADADYLGESTADFSGTRSDIGRFYPDRFAVAANSPDFADACAAGPSSFTYQDQTFYYGTAPILTVTALNAAGGTTENYGGGSSGAEGFWKLSSAMARSYTDQAGMAATFAAVQDASVTLTDHLDYDGDGTLALDAGTAGDVFMYSRTAAEGPFNADVDASFTAAALTDADGACYDADDNGACDTFAVNGIAGAELRFGRLMIGSAAGSELLALAVPLRTEYFSGIGFSVNTDDACTGIAANELILSSAVQGAQADGDVVVASGGSCPGAGCSTATVANDPMNSGDAGLRLSAPGEGFTGFAAIDIDLSSGGLNLVWLRYDWEADGGFDENPRGRATFGVFRGNDRLIYTREPWN